ncbi:large ribosomal subunit protein P1-like isoform X2 [Lissotriton helveticus]
MASVSELSCIYAALILHNDDVPVTALANIDIGSLICNVGAGGGDAPAAGAAVAATTAAAPAEDKKKEEEKKVESEESDDDMSFGLCD